MTRGECAYCRKEADKSELKRCARCQYLMYCSKECQVRSWHSTHKYNCQKRGAANADEEEDDKEGSREDKAFTAWLNTWSVSLTTTAAAALDLANNEEPDHLINHCLYMELKKTGYKSPERRYTVEEMGVCPVEPLREEFPELASLLVDPPELVGKRVRFLAVVKDEDGETERARARAWVDGNIESYRKLNKAHSRVMAQGLMAELFSAVEAGNVEAIPKLMKLKGC